ncbi:roadblock/LC7 domain-containing protein [Pontivivens ytuae]|uniref:Roadblock/LC7 domain-containing protein n=2 Tax=Pontivivens ytuae TaxID=2789856 RepID=A0A7S9LVQ3_9RHOB|nr:roadblock/LC7 domain-containing protein [Pontivivens ytuae]
MQNQDLSGLHGLSGFIGACLVDSDSGMVLAKDGGGKLDMDVAGAANTDVVKAKLRAISSLDLDDNIEDILISLGKQYHLIRPLSDDPSVFLYLALDREQSNLAMARVALRKTDLGIAA